MTIKEVSEKTGLSADTLRYYERVGLIPPVERKNGGIRSYHDENIRWIEFAKCMRAAGLPVEMLVEYFRLFRVGDATMSQRYEMLVSERDNLEKRIAMMQATLERLNKKIARYDEKMISSEINDKGYFNE